MAEDEPKNIPDDFLRMLQELLSGNGAVDPSQLAGAAGLPTDPASIAALMAQLQRAIGQSDGGIDWSVAVQHGEQRAAAQERLVETAERDEYATAVTLAELWLDEATGFATTGLPPKLMTRRQWVSATMPLWTELATPVAGSVADALTKVVNDEAPSEMQNMIAGADGFLRSIGGTLFAMQLGNVVGQLGTEVVSGGDVGIPLLDEGHSALLPQNISAFGADLDVPASEIALYLTVRELAHARLMKHARWLRLEFMSSLREFARGVHIDMSKLQDVAEGFDPSRPEDLQRALRDGSLIPAKTEAQLAALSRLETTLALIEGWVDAVTAAATRRLPSAAAIAETIRRRRATGGPAESAFGSLVGLELRPRLLREAASMWARIGDAVGIDARDALWQYPDGMPTAADVNDSEQFLSKLAGTAPISEEDRAFDEALDALLRGDTPPAPTES